jgi:hypothetical protein
VHVVTVSFAGTQFDDEVAAFGDWLVASDWYKGTVEEYGLGQGTHERRSLSETPPATISAAAGQDFISDHVASGALPAPTADGQFLYVFYVPPETSVTDIFGGCDQAPTTPSAFHTSDKLQNGKEVSLTVSVPAGTPSGSASGVGIISLRDDGLSTLWVFMVEVE